MRLVLRTISARLFVVIVSRAVLRTNSLTRDSAFGTVRKVRTNWAGSVIRQTAQTVTSTFFPSAVGTSTSRSSRLVPCQTWSVLGSRMTSWIIGSLK